ncbi:MAG TPA: cytochrome c peroxidase [Pirellulales bacterium]|nr:cytochrome c peroxidase [Pirellulales bacterium]
MSVPSKFIRGIVPVLAIMALCIGCQPTQQPGAAEPAKSREDAAADSAAKAAADTAGTATADTAAPDAQAAEDKSAGHDASATSDKTAASGGKVKLGSPELTAGIPGSDKLTDEQIEAWLNDAHNHETLDIELPLGLDAGAAQIQGIDKNPLTRAKIELGRQLYFDSRLSADTSTACASCHSPDEGFARHTQFGVGLRNQTGGRNSPVSYNRILSGRQFWDGRAESLEAQAVGPIANPIEMGNTHDACIECLKGIPGYKLQFDKIFGKLDIDTVGQAIASFERAIVTGPSPYDYYERLRPFEKQDLDDIKADPELNAKYEQVLADAKAHPMSDGAKRGRELYFTDKANCSACHVGANLTDEKYHNIGIGMDKPSPDIGREEYSNDPKDKGAFKTPTIRNVALSAPYMHDGGLKTLEEVVEWYAKGGHPNPALSDKIKKLNLTDQDKQDLVEFMKACTGEFPKVARDRIPQ